MYVLCICMYEYMCERVRRRKSNNRDASQYVCWYVCIHLLTYSLTPLERQASHWSLIHTSLNIPVSQYVRDCLFYMMCMYVCMHVCVVVKYEKRYTSELDITINNLLSHILS